MVVNAHTLSFADISIDLERYEARVGEEPVALTFMEFELLEELVRAEDKVVTRDQLASLWQRAGRDIPASPGINQVISRLRHRLGTAAACKIETVRSRGYRLRIADWTGPAPHPHATRQTELGNLIIDFDRCTASVSGHEAELTFLEFEVLSLLVRNAGHVVLREHVAQQLWEGYPRASGRPLNVHIARIRRKLHGIAPWSIRTIRLDGYMLAKHPAIAIDEPIEH